MKKFLTIALIATVLACSIAGAVTDCRGSTDQTSAISRGTFVKHDVAVYSQVDFTIASQDFCNPVSLSHEEGVLPKRLSIRESQGMWCQELRYNRYHRRCKNTIFVLTTIQNKGNSPTTS